MPPKEYFRDDYVRTGALVAVRLLVISVFITLAGFFLILGLVGGAR